MQHAEWLQKSVPVAVPICMIMARTIEFNIITTYGKKRPGPSDLTYYPLTFVTRKTGEIYFKKLNIAIQL